MKQYMCSQTESYLEDIVEAIDFDALEGFLKGHIRAEISFEELVRRVVAEGISALDADTVCTFAFDSLFYEISLARPLFIKILLFTVLFGIAHRLLSGKNRYISDMGYMIIYATLMVLLMQSFFLVRELALEGIDTLLTFLAVLIPTYAAAMVFSGNAVTGAMLYELAFFLVYVVEIMIRVVLSPVVHLFVLVLLLNHLFEEDKLSKLAQLLESGTNLILKTAFGAVIGLGVVQSLLTPAKDRLAGNAVLSGLTSIPGVGNVVGSAGEVLLSCGMMIKNSVGIVGLLILVFLAVLPVIKIGYFNLMYHLLSVMLQPVVDPRLAECVSGVARGCGLYLKMIVYTMMLFFVLFSIVSAASSFIF